MIGERPADMAENFQSSSTQRHGKLGVTVENINPQAARQMNLSSSVGALVTEVQPGSPADEAGVRPGDVIRGINQDTVSNASDLMAAVQRLKSGDVVRLKVMRNDQILFLAFELS